MSIYSHLDPTTTVGQIMAWGYMPPAMKLIDFATRAQWGRLVSWRHNGKVRVYELDFGGDHKVFTFVTWVDEDL